MAITILLLNWCSTVLWIYALTGEFRQSWIKSSLIYGLIITFLTEGLSFNRSLTPVFVIYFWSIVLVFHVGLGIYFRQTLVPVCQHLLSVLYVQLKTFKQTLKLLIGATLFICLITALLAPPNNWDSMTYHMPRVMHWLSNASVAHYPTAELRQISLPPLSGFLIGHFYLFTNNDLLSNLVQWMAFLGCILTNSLITRLLVGAEYQWWSALVTCAIPMAIMQATTTQNDLLVSYWLLCFLYFVICIPPDKNYTLGDIFWLGSSLGLATFTKPTAYIFGLTIVLYLCWRIYRQNQDNWVTKLLLLCIFAIITIAPSLLYFLRNIAIFSSPIGVDGGTRNTILGIPQLLSNLLRLLAINLPLPNIWLIINWIHDHFLGISINDVHTSFITNIEKYTTMVGSLRFIAPHEDFVGSPIHLIVYLWSVVGLWWAVLRRCNNLNSTIIAIFWVNLGGLFLFCLLLKWQPWSNRLLLPLVVMNTVIIVYGMKNYLLPFMRKILLGLLSLTAIVYALTPVRHPLISLPFLQAAPSILTLQRQDMYLIRDRHELQSQYKQIVQDIKAENCLNIGLSIEGEAWEYPLWVFLRENYTTDIKIVHVGVNNVSQKIPPILPENQLCKIVTLPSYRE